MGQGMGKDGGGGNKALFTPFIYGGARVAHWRMSDANAPLLIRAKVIFMSLFLRLFKPPECSCLALRRFFEHEESDEMIVTFTTVKQ